MTKYNDKEPPMTNDTTFSEEEKAAADNFANEVESLLGGRACHQEGDVELLETVKMIHWGSSENQRIDINTDAMVDEVLSSKETSLIPSPYDELAARRKKRVVLPWICTGLAAAAAMFFALWQPTITTKSPSDARSTLGHVLLSTDLLIGEIPPSDAGKASKRTNIIYSHHLAHYRETFLLRVPSSQVDQRRVK